MDKYYTPEFEDISVGLKYEFNDRGKWLSMDVWYYTDLLKLRDSIREDLMRVKYLDQKDIEAFDFMEDEDASPIEGVFHIKFEKHRVDKDGRLMNIELSYMIVNDKPLLVLTECEEQTEEDFEVIYSAFCFNKSEFERLLKRTEIIQ